MSSTWLSTPTLTLLSSSSVLPHAHANLREREISRELLLEIAPDREVLLLSNKGIEELRHTLKIRVGEQAKGHWLYRSRKRVDTNARRTNTRISTLVRAGTPEREKDPENDNIHVLRRVLSASSVSPLSGTMMSIENRLFAPPTHDIDLWDGATFITGEKLVSPRPLGPTHILVVHALSSPLLLHPATHGRRRTKSSNISPPSSVFEFPVNDLLFVLNVPNLAPALPILPPRLHKELPRVAIQVPHVETFHELMIYLHTQNQAELFRRIVPEWIRDLMHPFPELCTFGEPRSISRMSRQLLGMFLPDSGSDTSVDSVSSAFRPMPSTLRTMEFISRDIAEVAHSMTTDEVDPLLRTVSMLNALRDNLEHIGYFAQPLWKELNFFRDVLVRSVSHTAKINTTSDDDF